MFALIRMAAVLHGEAAAKDIRIGSWSNRQAQFCAGRQVGLGTHLGKLWCEHDWGTACRARLRGTLQSPLLTHPWTSNLATS